MPQMLFFHGCSPLSKSFGASQVVQDLFHQPYHSAHLDFLQVFSVDDPMECTEWTRKRPFATEAPHDLRGSGTWMLLETRLRSDDGKKVSPFQRFVGFEISKFKTFCLVLFKAPGDGRTNSLSGGAMRQLPPSRCPRSSGSTLEMNSKCLAKDIKKDVNVEEANHDQSESIPISFP